MPDRGTNRHRPAPPRFTDHWRLVVGSFLVAGIAGLIVSYVVPPSMRDIAVLAVVWIVFYPVARVDPQAPWWLHWARGLVVLLAFLAMRHVFH